MAPQSNIRRTEDVAGESASFDGFGLPADLLQSLYVVFRKPSPIQEKVIPQALEGKSVIARAKNGTGKTGSYLIPILAKVRRDYTRSPQALIFVSTRELALQVAMNARGMSTRMRPAVVTSPVFGGQQMPESIEYVKSSHIIVGTPGRMKQLFMDGHLDLAAVRFFVFDEADEILLRSTFFADIEPLLKEVPVNKRQTFVVSATMPEAMRPWAEKWLPRDRQSLYHVNLMEDSIVLRGVSQYYVFIEDEKQKVPVIRKIMKMIMANQVIIFCNTPRRAHMLTDILRSKCDYSVECLAGDMSMKDRKNVFMRFRQNNVRILVCSALVDRGIDVPSVNVVFNYDIPKDSASYLHRIGRGGRFGQYAIAINLVTAGDVNRVQRFKLELNHDILRLPKEIPQHLYSGEIPEDEN